MDHHTRLILHLLLVIVAGGSAVPSQAQWQTEYRGLGVQSFDIQLLQTAKQDWHANQLRYMMAPEWVAEKGGITREQAWTSMLNALPQQLDNAHALGIAVIVDLHQLPAVSPNEPYAGDNEAQSHAWWTDSENRDIMINAWEQLAQITATRTNQNIWLELYNEPLDWYAFPSYPVNWPSWAQEILDAIRIIDTAHPIVIQTGPGTLPWGLATWPGLVDPSTNDLIYSIHQYNPISYSHQGVSSSNVIDWTWADTGGWNKERIRTDELQYAKDYQDTHGVRIHVGEFSAPRWAPNADKYIRDHLELFEEYGWDWNYHAFDAAKVWDLKYPEQVDLYDGSGTYVRTGIADPDEGLFYPPYGTPPLVPLAEVAGFTERGELVLEYLSRNLDDGPVPGENLAITNGLWIDPAIWDQGYVPDTTDDRAKIWANHTVTVDSVVTTEVSNIRLGSMLQNPGHLVIDPGAALTNNGLLQISGGVSNSVGSSVTFNGTYHNGGNMDVGYVSSTGQGGRLFINTGAVVTVAGVINVGLGSTGTVTMTGGTVVQYGTGNDGDTQIGIGERQYGELDMSGGTWITGDDLIVGSGAGNNRTGKAVFSGGATMNVVDDLFMGFYGHDNCNGEVVVYNATLDINDALRVGRYNSCTGTLTLAHADAWVETWWLYVAADGGDGTVNLLEGKLSLRGSNIGDTLLQIGAGGRIIFEKGVLAWNDNTTADELEQFWVNGDFIATKSDANFDSFTNTLDSITYSQDLGDGYTAWVGLDGGVAKTFVTTDNPLVVAIGNISINIAGTDAIIGWNGTAEANYTLQSKSALTNPSWSAEQSGIPGMSGTMSATTTTASAESFYRVISP